MPLNFGSNFLRNDPFSSGRSDEIMSFSPTQFKAEDPSADSITYDSFEVTDNGGHKFFCPIHLPNGSTIIKAIVYGGGGTEDETWNLVRTQHNTGTPETVTNQFFNVFGDTTAITKGIVNNQLFHYCFTTTTMTATDEIRGAVIHYTTRGRR